MLRRHVICVYLGILAAWMQFVAPVAALTMDGATDPLGIICSRTTSNVDRGAPPIHYKHHGDCCLLCHVDLGAAPPAERPVFTVFDYPIASVERWQIVRSPPPASLPRHEQLPRGPPSLV